MAELSLLDTVCVEFERENSSFADDDSTPRRASCSGVLVDVVRGLVLTSGFLLSLFFAKIKDEQNPSRSGEVERGFSNVDKKTVNKLIKNSYKFFVVFNDKSDKNPRSSVSFSSVKAEARPVRLFPFPSLGHDLKQLLHENLKLTHDDDELITDDDILVKMLSSFILLQFNPSSKDKVEGNEAIDGESSLTRIINTRNIVRKVFEKLLLFTIDVEKSDIVWSESNLFGTPHPVFMNSLSRGIVVNVFGRLMLTDARTTPGSEGGILFQEKRKKSWAGIIVAPLLWKDKEPIGLTLACRAPALIKHFLRNEFVDAQRVPHSTNARKGFESIVLIKVGFIWGSGIVIDQHHRLVITCSHVVKEASEVLIYTEFPEPNVLDGKVLFRTPNADTFDVAVIQMFEKIHITPSSLYKNSECYVGQEVLAVGYSLFSSHWNHGSVITSGVISKIISSKSCPVLIQTSCAVYSGASGGGIFDRYNKRLIAMIVCNSKDVENNTTYPTVNLALPIAVVFPLIKKFLLSKEDIQSLSSLHSKDKAVRQLWHLGNATSDSCSSKL